MIEVVSSPADLSGWDPSEHPFYLEFFGETEPVVDTAFAEAIPAGGSAPQSTTAAPIYEYWWTIGHPGSKPRSERWAGVLEQTAFDAPVWERLDEVAARVYLYFPTTGGWRIKEAAAGLNYLSPVKDQRSWWKATAETLAAIEPFVTGAASIASPVVGGTASKALDAVAKLQAVSVPQTKDFAWSVAKVTFRPSLPGAGVMQGVLWELPKAAFSELGGRLTGSLALSLIPARAQTAQPVTNWQPQPLSALAHATLYPADGQPIFLPGPTSQKFLELRLTPQPPSTK